MTTRKNPTPKHGRASQAKLAEADAAAARVEAWYAGSGMYKPGPKHPAGPVTSSGLPPSWTPPKQPKPVPPQRANAGPAVASGGDTGQRGTPRVAGAKPASGASKARRTGTPNAIRRARSAQ
jgi:hypothetical protein